MDTEHNLHNLKLKKEPVDNTSEISSMLHTTLQEKIEFCNIESIKKDYFIQHEIKSELEKFDCNPETEPSHETIVKKCLSFSENDADSLSEDKKHDTRGNGDNNIIPEQLFVQKYKQLGNADQKYVSVESVKNNANIKNFVCDTCKKEFHSRRAICAHVQWHNKSLYKCEICDKYLCGNSGLKLHLTRHKNQKNCKCNICSKYFINSSVLKRHLLIHQDKNFECDICRNKFTQKSEVISHITAVHISNKEFQCEMCEKRFARKCNLRGHMVIHGGFSEYQCHVCNKYFGQATNLSIHLTTHSKVRSFKCDLCDMVFSNNHYLTCHMKVHENIRYTCHICGNTFSRKTYLLKHMEIHNSDKQYLCHVCHKSFWIITALKAHIKFHGVVYTCIVCGNGYVNKYSLTEHMKKHEGNNKHICQICNKLYAHRSGLQKHMKAHF